MPYGRQQPLGCHWCSKRPLAGGMPHPPYKGFVHRTSSPSLWPPELPDHLTRKDTGCSQGIVGLCRSVWSQVMSLMWSHQRAPTMHGPIDDHQWGWYYGSLLLRPVKEELGPSPTPEEEATPLGEREGPSGAPGPVPLWVEICRSVEPAEQTTAPVTSTAPHHHPSLKRGKFWKGIDINSNNTGQRVRG